MLVPFSTVSWTGIPENWIIYRKKRGKYAQKSTVLRYYTTAPIGDGLVALPLAARPGSRAGGPSAAVRPNAGARRQRGPAAGRV